MPQEPHVQTSNLAVECETALGLSSSPSQPWSRVSDAHPGTHPVTRQQPRPGTWWESHPPHWVEDLLSEERTVDPEVDSCPSIALLNKVLEAVPSTQGPNRIHACPKLW